VHAPVGVNVEDFDQPLAATLVHTWYSINHASCWEIALQFIRMRVV
jgi:hypothetical protein